MRKILFSLSSLCLVILLAGCQQSNDRSCPETIEYSNLLNDSVQEELSVIMSSAGISDERQEIFFEHVDQFNSCLLYTSLSEFLDRAHLLTTRKRAVVLPCGSRALSERIGGNR